MTRLGAFTLHRVIGSGGMGEVWSGTHDSGVPVAVKVLGARQMLADNPAHAEAYRSSFEREVRAVARLRHPNIVTVLDHGTVGRTASIASGGTLHPESPYLAMELASGGTLADLGPTLAWPDLRAMLLSILDGLAHAHARGVVHRDIKPPNLLRCTGDDVEPGWKLADFGIAHALSASPVYEQGEASAGTPWYMAPEQFRAAWRDLGPWTDLYGLGCVAWQVATGAAPFEGSFIEVMLGHTREPLPQFHPASPVPDGFSDWLKRLLAKNIADRPRWAATARRALLEIDTDAPGATPDTQAPPAAVRPETAPTQLLTPSAAPHAISAPLGQGYSPPERAQLPATWRHEATAHPQLIGAGLGLFGLRPVPLVDRDTERGVLWKALRGVLRDGGTQVVQIRGDTGVGKTRLARWLHHLAREFGVAQTVWADHAAGDGPLVAWASALGSVFGTNGLEGLELTDRLRALLAGPAGQPQLPSEQSDTTADLSAPAAASEHPDLSVIATAALLETDPTGATLATPTHRLHAFVQALRLIAHGGPLLLTLDDLQFGDDSCALLDHLEAEPAGFPLLVVATVGSGGLQPPARDGDLNIGPLGRDDHALLVDEILQLDPELARPVVDRTSGNPLFAMQLIGDWVQRDLLVPGPQGFLSRESRPMAVPESVENLWSDQLRHPDDHDRADSLQVAAVLGVEVHHDEWLAACRHAGVSPSARLVTTCEEADLVAVEADGFRFRHGRFRESLLRRADDTARVAELHLACAHALLEVFPKPNAAARARIARHFMGAGEPARAELHVNIASRHWLQTADYRQARRLLEQLLESSDGGDSEALAEARLLRARLDRLASNLDTAAQGLEVAMAQADARGWVRLSAEARIEASITALYRSRDIHSATQWLNEARRLAKDADLHDLLGRSWRGLAQLRLVVGDLVEARPLLQRALAAYQEAGDTRGIAAAWSGLGWAYTTPEDASRALELFEEAQRFGREHGYAYVIADAQTGLGETQRLLGNLRQAEAHLRAALRLHGLTGSVDPAALINLGLLLVDLGEWAEARQTLEDASAFVEGKNQHVFREGIALGLVVCTAAQEDWPAFDGHMTALGPELTDKKREFYLLAEQASSLCEAAGKPERAARIGALAIAQPK